MSVSQKMRARLSAIESLVSQGYSVGKEWNAFPFLVASNGSKKSITLLKNPAGFSWIAFFFPFAVCTQIKEWSYFYVSSLIFILASLVSALVGYDLSNAAGMSIAIMYGMYFPYLRYMAIERNIQENSIGYSIVVGLILAVVAAAPSLLIDAVVAGGQ